MSKALLIGNDINSLSSGYDWKKLLEELIEYVEGARHIKPLNEQFPLFYEEICAYSNKYNIRSEKEIKNYICKKLANLEPNDIHRELLALEVPHVMTTNYDFSLEKASKEYLEEEKIINTGIVNEKRYSVFRNYKLGNIRYWHIHGDSLNTNSIALGYEHYSGYLQSMRSYIVSGTKDTYKNVRLDSLIKRIRAGELAEHYSWLEIFLTNDVHIVGLGLDFVEIHLWWLLTYRARSGSSGKAPFGNKIYYYYPEQRKTVDSTKLRLLKSNNVILVSCKRPNSDKQEYYADVIKQLGNRI